jgi:hypothetical protein
MKGNNHTCFGLCILGEKNYEMVWKKNVLTVDFMGEKKNILNAFFVCLLMKSN